MSSGIFYYDENEQTFKQRLTRNLQEDIDMRKHVYSLIKYQIPFLYSYEDISFIRGEYDYLLDELIYKVTYDDDIDFYLSSFEQTQSKLYKLHKG